MGSSFCQEYIELLEGSEDIKIDGKTGNYIVKGNVVFKKEETKLYCDSAYYNLVHNTVRAFGNIHLNKEDTLNMFCDSLFFDTKKDYAKLYGNVRIRDNEYKLTTDSMDYDLKNNVGIYKNKGVITSISSSDQLSSDIGYFYPNSKQFNFRKNVVYTSNDFTVKSDTLQFNANSKKAYFFGPTYITNQDIKMYCEKGWYDLNEDEGVLENNASIENENLNIGADSLFYSSKDSLYIAKKNVLITDTTNKIGFQGDYAINDERNKFAFITGHALAKRFEEKDTLYIHADTLYNYSDSLGKPMLMQAHKKVKLFRGDMQGICDSLIYDKTIGEMNMFTNPTLWAQNAQLTSDTITIYEKDNRIHRAFLRKNGLVATPVDSTNYYNQVAGTLLNAYFDSTQIRRVDIEGNAKTLYFLEDEDESDTAIVVNRQGMNRIFSSNITLRFVDGDIETATYRDSPDGLVYPISDIDKKEERVEQFKWNEENRPLSWQDMIYSEDEKKIILELYSRIFRNI
ncbi:OstA-like protein [Brumimicrobium mesophilum]|uniref:OstA-like protein n=1 Tax=Brumimicrobium mesophilum TaxID=392717 RepID=UPI00131D19E4|nr:OstA-like protein [Brumimicrobium mesophilum]